MTWKPSSPSTTAPQRLRLEQLPEQLREARRLRGLTLKEVEAETGLSISTLSRIENGRFRPNVTHYQKLLQWLGLSPTEVELQTNSSEAQGDTMTKVALLLKRDPKLSDNAADKLLRAWRPMYALYADDNTHDL